MKIEFHVLCISYAKKQHYYLECCGKNGIGGVKEKLKEFI